MEIEIVVGAGGGISVQFQGYLPSSKLVFGHSQFASDTNGKHLYSAAAVTFQNHSHSAVLIEPFKCFLARIETYTHRLPVCTTSHIEPNGGIFLIPL